MSSSLFLSSLVLPFGLFVCPLVVLFGCPTKSTAGALTQTAYSPHRIECSSTQSVFFLSVRFIIMEMYIIVYVTMPKWMVTQRARILFAQSNKDTRAHIQEAHTPIHVRRNSCILSSTRYPVNHKQQRQHMWHLNEHRSPRKPHLRLHTRSHYETHTEKRSHKSRYDLSSIAQLLFSFFCFCTSL